MHVSQQMWPQLDTANFDPLFVKHWLQWNQSILGDLCFLVCKQSMWKPCFNATRLCTYGLGLIFFFHYLNIVIQDSVIVHIIVCFQLGGKNMAKAMPRWTESLHRAWTSVPSSTSWMNWNTDYHPDQASSPNLSD